VPLGGTAWQGLGGMGPLDPQDFQNPPAPQPAPQGLSHLLAPGVAPLPPQQHALNAVLMEHLQAMQNQNATANPTPPARADSYGSLQAGGVNLEPSSPFSLSLASCSHLVFLKSTCRPCRTRTRQPTPTPRPMLTATAAYRCMMCCTDSMSSTATPPPPLAVIHPTSSRLCRLQLSSRRGPGTT